MKIVDITEEFIPGTFPPCPVCDNKISVSDGAVIAIAHGSMALVHLLCVLSKVIDQPDEE
jgi:hypothetical protein